ncbi:MAG: DUF4145 domain-containing protein [Nitrosomonas sp.]|nr:DUF4145 domain-containing protein [Nitrosomonas sp.]
MLVLCKDCDKKVDGIVHGVYQYHDVAAGPPKKITLLNCPRCQHATVVEEIEKWSGYWTGPITVYPSTISGLSDLVPDNLRNSFNESASCFNAGSFNASAIMCRRTLEGLCLELGINERNLSLSLKTLGEMGYIEGSLIDWADALRIVGNEAAHNLNINISSLDAKDLLEFTEAILDYIYVFKKKFSEFKARRDAKKNP